MRNPTTRAISVPSAPLTPRRIFIICAIFLVGLIYVSIGLFFRQVIQSNDLVKDAEYQSQRVVIRPPARGIIHDRNGQILVENRVR